MKIKKVICIALCAMMVLFSITGCGNNSKDTTPKDNVATPNSNDATKTSLDGNPAANGGNVLRYICTSPPGVFNGILWTATYDQYICELVFDRLLKYDPKTLEFMPQLAEKWTVDEADKSITFNIRKGAKIHGNLGEMTAEDVAFTLSMILNPKYDGTFYGNFNSLVGAEDYKAGKTDTVEGIILYGEKPDKPLPVKYDNSENDAYKIKLKFTELSLSPMHILASSVFILPRAYYEKATYEEFKALNLSPVGSGPMVFKQYVIDQYVELDKNTEYWGGVPKLDKVIYKCVSDDARIAAMQSGEADLCEVRNIDEDLVQVEELNYVDIQKQEGTSFAFIRFRFDNPIVQDLKVRQALAYGFDRAGFVKSYTSGRSELVYAPVARNSSAYPQGELEKYEYNPEKAKQLLDEAGWKVNEKDNFRYKDGKKLQLTYTGVANNKNDSTKTAVMIENYKGIGVDFSAEFFDWATYMETVKTRDNVALFGYAWNSSADPFRNSQLFTTGALTNDGRYSNAEYDALIDKAKLELDPTKAGEYYQEAFTILNKEVPALFLNDYTTPWVINNRVKNVKVAPYISWTYDIQNVEIVQ